VLSTGPTRRAEVHQSGTCTCPETSHTSVAAADLGHNRRHRSGRTSVRVQPPAILAQEVVATRTTTPDGAINARVRHRRDAEKPRDDHGGHRDDDRAHNKIDASPSRPCPVNRIAEPLTVTRNVLKSL
jgi:hypothetical protein